MLSRKTFVEAINNIKKHEEIMEKLHDIVREMGDFPPNLDFENLKHESLMSVLKESMNDKYDYIGWWLYEATDDFTVSWEEDGRHEERNLETVDALYNFLVEQTRTTQFEDLPIHDETPPDKYGTEAIPYKVISKDDFFTYFDRVLDYIDTNEVVLEIRGEGKDRYVLLSIRYYNKMLAEEDALKEKLESMEKQDGKRVCDSNS